MISPWLFDLACVSVAPVLYSAWVIGRLTAMSRGLLTNTATGGWRRDVSLFSERFASLPSSNLPLFTLQPGKVQTYSKAPSSGSAANPILCPWATYRNNGSGSSWEQVPPIASWTGLVDYMTQYRKLSTSNASRKKSICFTSKVHGTFRSLDDGPMISEIPSGSQGRGAPASRSFRLSRKSHTRREPQTG